MGKITLTIEDEVFDFEIDRIGLYAYKIKDSTYFLNVQDVYEKGFSFRMSSHSAMSYWWGMETRPLYICSVCYDLFEKTTLISDLGKLMVDNHLCFSCALWELRAQKENHLVIDGVRYSLGPGNSGGMGGRKFTIEYFDGKVIETRDLWCQGEVPEYFKDRIPDTARFSDGAYFDKEVKAWQSSR